MKLYHGTKHTDPEHVMDYPKATKAAGGVGFYLTPDHEVARMYGNHVICYEIPNDWNAGIVRPIEALDGNSMEYVLTQAEADRLVIDHALDIYLV